METKGTWKNLEGTFRERAKALSDVECACGCGGFISNRAAKRKEKGLTAGYIKGHGWKGKKLPEITKEKIRKNHVDYSGENNPNFGKGLFGEDNPNWQGGKTALYDKGHNQPGAGSRYDRDFKKNIRKRDGKCVLCGNTSRLHAHHIEPWMEREDLRYDERNCVTLCIRCHTRADNAHHKEEIKPMLVAYINELYKDEVQY